MISPEIKSILNSHFDKIFVVSVPRFEERHAAINKKLKGLDFTYFWGADKQQLDYNLAVADGTYNETKAKELQRQGKALNLGEIACSLSHRNLYGEMIKNNWQKVLILEDDVLPLQQNMHLLAETLSELPSTWELVYLGYLKHDKVTAGLKAKRFFYRILSAFGLMTWSAEMVSNMLPRPYSKHLRKAGFHDCTHAYAISLTAAKKLFKTQSPVVYRADDLLSANILKGEIEAYITDPKFFDQEIFHQTGPASEIKE